MNHEQGSLPTNWGNAALPGFSDLNRLDLKNRLTVQTAGLSTFGQC